MNVLLLYRRGQILTGEKLNVFHLYITLFPGSWGCLLICEHLVEATQPPSLLLALRVDYP